MGSSIPPPCMHIFAGTAFSDAESLPNGWFQKISLPIPIPRAASQNSKGEGGRTAWNFKGKGGGGLSILGFRKARGALDEDATRGRVWIFSGITQYTGKPNHC